MSTWRLWMVSAGAVAVIAVIVVVLLLTTDSGAPVASPSPSSTPTATAPAQTPSPAPTPSPTAHPLVDATCQDVLTEEYLAQVAADGLQVWDTGVLAVGATPFDDFPEGAPLLQLVCRTGTDPDASADAQDHAWARIHAESAVAAMQQLEADGYRRSDAAEGVYLSRTAAPGAGDGDGTGQTYLFTATDVRWAQTRADLSAIRPAAELR